MKKKLYSLVVIITTIVSTFTMTRSWNYDVEDELVNNGVQENKYVKHYYYVKETDADKVEQDDVDSGCDISKINKEINDEKEDVVLDQDKKEIEQEVDDSENEKNESQEDKVINSYMNNDKYQISLEEDTRSVFKQDKNNMKLSAADKAKLFLIAKKLSKSDYKRLEDYIYSDDAELAVKNCIHLLRDRLTDKDYEKVKKILNKYIYLNAAEN
ncbi:MAG: hypothetical protein ACERKV_05555 [Clostridiaceae bacterium]